MIINICNTHIILKRAQCTLLVALHYWVGHILELHILQNIYIVHIYLTNI